MGDSTLRRCPACEKKVKAMKICTAAVMSGALWCGTCGITSPALQGGSSFSPTLCRSEIAFYSSSWLHFIESHSCDDPLLAACRVVDDPYDFVASSNEEEKEEEEGQPAKRGSGRPRKAVQEVEGEEGGEKPAKRGPGRPRKVLQEGEGEREEEGGKLPAKRGPGRPRKSLQEEEDEQEASEPNSDKRPLTARGRAAPTSSPAKSLLKRGTGRKAAGQGSRGRQPSPSSSPTPFEPSDSEEEDSEVGIICLSSRILNCHCYCRCLNFCDFEFQWPASSVGFVKWLCLLHSQHGSCKQLSSLARKPKLPLYLFQLNLSV